MKRRKDEMKIRKDKMKMKVKVNINMKGWREERGLIISQY